MAETEWMSIKDGPKNTEPPASHVSIGNGGSELEFRASDGDENLQASLATWVDKLLATNARLAYSPEEEDYTRYDVEIDDDGDESDDDQESLADEEMSDYVSDDDEAGAEQQMPGQSDKVFVLRPKV